MTTSREQLLELIKGTYYEEAFAYYIEHKKELPFFERPFLRSLIEDGLDERGPSIHFYVLISVISEINILLSERFGFEVLDLLSPLAGRNIYFQYYIRWVLPLLNSFLIILLLFKVVQYVLYPKLILGGAWNKAALTTALGVGIYIIVDVTLSVSPLIQDYRAVVSETPMKRTISRSEMEGMIFDNIMRQNHDTLTESQKKSLEEEIQKATANHDKGYQTHLWYEPRKDKILFIFPTTAYNIYLSDHEIVKISGMQWKSFDFDPMCDKGIEITYLPHSRTILDIRNLEMGEGEKQ